jgi:hypothetical protein
MLVVLFVRSTTSVRYEACTMVKIHIVVSWIMTLCTMVGRYQGRSETYVLYQKSIKLATFPPPPHGLSPRANYTDRATAASRRSGCQLLRIKGATWSA